jgi:hypothetical protein
LGFEERLEVGGLHGKPDIGSLHATSLGLRTPNDTGGDGESPQPWGKHTTCRAVLGSVHKGALLSFGWGALEAPGETRQASSSVGL